MDPDEPRRRGGPRRVPVNRRGRAGGGRPAGGARGPRRDRSGRAPDGRRPAAPPRAAVQDGGFGRHEGPGYDDAPGYDDYGPGYGYGDGPGYGAGPGNDGFGYNDTPTHHDLPVYQDDLDHHGGPGGAPPLPGDGDGPGRKPKKRRPGGKPGRGRPTLRGGQVGPKGYFATAAVLCLLVLAGFGAVVALPGGEDEGPRPTAAAPGIGTPAGTGLSPDSYSSSASTSAYAGIATRRADPEPLTIEEVFPSAVHTLAVPDGDARVRLRDTRLDGDCADAVWGATLGGVLGEGGCTQVARGIYSGGARGYALAVAVFNLSGSEQADRFVAKLEETIGAGFVQPMEAEAPLDDFGRGFSMARGLAMGHFAVVAWSQRMDGRGGPQDETLLSLLIEGGKNAAVLGRAARTSD